MATADFVKTRTPSRATVAESVFQGGAMLGAACGALAGVSLAGDVFDGTYTAAIFGTLGTIVGSLGCALAGRYLIFPLWSALIAGSRRT